MNIFIAGVGLASAGSVALTSRPYPIEGVYPNSESFFSVFGYALGTHGPAFTFRNGLSDGATLDNFGILRYGGVSHVCLFGYSYDDMTGDQEIAEAVRARASLERRVYPLSLGTAENYTNAYDTPNNYYEKDHTAPVSLDYSFDVDGVHYVQLNAYPGFAIDSGTVHIISSLDWLETDLKNAQSRGLSSILVFTDGYGPESEFVKNTNSSVRDRFAGIIGRTNVKAIFTGCTHGEATACVAENDKFYANVPVYCMGRSGANEYVVLQSGQDGLTANVYNFLPGDPVVQESLGVVGARVAVSEACSE